MKEIPSLFIAEMVKTEGIRSQNTRKTLGFQLTPRQMLDHRSWILDCETSINSKHQCCKSDQEFWRGYNATPNHNLL